MADAELNERLTRLENLVMGGPEGGKNVQRAMDTFLKDRSAASAQGLLNEIEKTNREAPMASGTTITITVTVTVTVTRADEQ